MFGVDLGDGVAVAAFEVKSSEAECCMTYKIYSLKDGSRLLRIPRGGTHFGGVDSDRNGRVEMWTHDAAVVDGFERLRGFRLQFPCSVWLRFENDKLLEVSSEFQPYFDQVSAQIRAQMAPGQLQKFKLDAGRLAKPMEGLLRKRVGKRQNRGGHRRL